jgi:hypothetical protein
MKERSVSRRNFSGAFLGGMLGILLTGFVHASLLPVGCFLGVVLGWCYQEIWQSITSSCQRGVDRTQRVYSHLVRVLVTPTWNLKKLQLNYQPLLKVLHFIFFIPFWIFRSPLLFVRWLRQHPMNQAYALRGLAISSFLSLNALGVFFLWLFVSGLNVDYEHSAWPLLVILGAFITILALSLSLVELCQGGRRGFYSTWDKYTKSGAISFFFLDLRQALSLEGRMFFVSLVTLAWFSGLGLLFLVVVILPISSLVGLTRGVYRATTQGGYWMCFAMTLITTSVVAWFTHPYFGDDRLLWAAALLAGLASAVVTKAIHSLLLRFFVTNQHVERVVIEDLGQRLLPSWRFFKLINRKTIGSLTQRLVPEFDLG